MLKVGLKSQVVYHNKADNYPTDKNKRQNVQGHIHILEN